MTQSTSDDELQREVVRQLIASIPERWTEAKLELEMSSTDGMDEIQHVITSTKFPRDLAEPTEELMMATRALMLGFKERGYPLKAASYDIWQEDGNWRFRANFTYPDDESRSQP